MTHNILWRYKQRFYAHTRYTQLAYITCAITIAIILWYIAAINFNLSFMTMDELNSLLSTFSDTYADVAANGRISHIIAWPVVEPLSFHNPTVINLVPRFLSIIFLYATLVAYLQSIFKSWIYSISFASIAMGGHLVGWQHNGMVAFFGSYNIFLGAFLLSLIIVKSNKNTGFVKQASIYLLLFASFSSEFFVGFSVLCAIYFYISKDKRLKSAKPFLGSIAFYILLFIIFNFFLNTPLDAAFNKKAAMDNYLYGNIDGSFSVHDIIKGAWIYLYHSIPISSFKMTSNYTYLYIMSSTLLGFLLIYGRVKAVIIKNGLTELILVASVLFIVPNFLLALQPTKLQWALSGASNRYVFSYYSWIGFVFIMSAIMYSLSKKNTYALVLFSIVFGPFVVNSMNSSIKFTGPYAVSTKKWRNLNDILENTTKKSVTVSEEYLEHPGITPINEKYLSDFAKKYYNKNLSVLSNPADGFNFGPRIPSFITSIDGLSGYEKDGRWTDGNKVQFSFKNNVPNKSHLKLILSGAYGPNNGSNVIVNVGDWSGTFVASPGKTITLNISKTTKTNKITFIIPHPISPKELGKGYDNRKLGIRFTHLSFKPTK